MALKGQVTIAANNVQQTLNLEVGTLQETITVRGGPAEPPDPERERMRVERSRSVQPRANDCAPRSTVVSTRRADAPTAMRTPISRVRRDGEYAMTP